MQENIKIERGILYRQQIVKNATRLLDQLLNLTWLRSLNEEIDILVIGAGTFPSFEALINKLTGLKKIKLTLVDTSKNATDFFLSHFANKFPVSAQITFEIQNICIKEFLISCKQSYDLIFFEHPETMTLPLILNKIGFKKFSQHLTFRESFPFLNNIIKTNTLIIASCMSRHELKQLKNLLQYSLQGLASLFFSKNPVHLFYGGPYSSGLCFQTRAKEQNAITLSNKIKKSDTLLCLFVLVSLIFYFIKSPQQVFFVQFISLVLIGAQLFFHRPDKRGFFIKCFLLGLQLIL